KGPVAAEDLDVSGLRGGPLGPTAVGGANRDFAAGRQTELLDNRLGQDQLRSPGVHYALDRRAPHFLGFQHSLLHSCHVLVIGNLQADAKSAPAVVSPGSCHDAPPRLEPCCSLPAHPTTPPGPAATVNVGSNSDAFGVADNTVRSALDLLLATDAQAVNGLLYNGNTTKRNHANNV